jgi:hypothetical protein
MDRGAVGEGAISGAIGGAVGGFIVGVLPDAAVSALGGAISGAIGGWISGAISSGVIELIRHQETNDRGQVIVIGMITSLVAGALGAFLLSLVGFSKLALPFVVVAIGGAVGPCVYEGIRATGRVR